MSSPVRIECRRSARRVGAAVIGALVGLMACSSPLPRTMPARPNANTDSGTDEAAANRVSVALNEDPTYFFRHVDVRVDEGVAYLSGYVWTADAIYRARQITRDVPGVRGVVTSHLELERNGSTRGSTR